MGFGELQPSNDPELVRFLEGNAPDDVRGAFLTSSKLGMSGVGKMLTASGRVFNIGSPTPDMVCIEDVAHHLSLCCRWACAVKTHYSVAQHSIMVANLLPRHLQLAGLLHDAHEAYIGDKTRPMKQLMPPLVQQWWALLRDNIDRAICDALGCAHQQLGCEAVKNVDLRMLAAEGRDLVARFTEEVALPHTNNGTPLPNCSMISRIIPWPIEMVRSAFISTYKELSCRG